MRPRSCALALIVVLVSACAACTDGQETVGGSTTTALASTSAPDLERDLVAAERRVAELEAELFTATSTTVSTVAQDPSAASLGVPHVDVFPSGENDFLSDAQTRRFDFWAENADVAELDFMKDSLCVRFPAEVMDDIVVIAAVESGTPVPFEGFPDSDDCRHEPGVAATWRTRTPDSWDEDGLTIEFGRVVGFGQYYRPSPMEPDEFVPHAALHRSVTYGNSEFSNVYGWVPNTGEAYAQLRVEGHEDAVLLISVTVTDSENGASGPDNRYEWFAFEVANLILERMGWIDCMPTGCA